MSDNVKDFVSDYVRADVSDHLSNEVNDYVRDDLGDYVTADNVRFWFIFLNQYIYLWMIKQAIIMRQFLITDPLLVTRTLAG